MESSELRSADSTEPLLRMLNGHCLQQAIYVAAVLGLADRLATGPQEIAELATNTATHPLSLLRLLRVLASIRVLEEEPDGRFVLAAMGEMLRTDVPGPVHDRALYYGSAAMWAVWGNLLHSVRTGESACAHIYGAPFYEHLLRHPEAGDPFNRYMGSGSKRHTEALLQVYDFGGIGTLVDVGGGLGDTLAAILATYPDMRGIVFDIDSVAKEAGGALLAAGFTERCGVASGNMQERVPTGGDAYLLKWVLMDRGDDEAITVLRNCAAAMAPGGRVLAVEMAMPPDNRPSFARLMDLQMMLLFGGGRIRTEAELRGLFRRSGLEVIRVLAAPPSPNIVIEGRYPGPLV